MENSIHTAEAFAHYVRGALTLFFLVRAYSFYSYRNLNSMMRLLYLTLLCLTFCYFKDVVLLFDCCKNDVHLADLINITDLLTIPLACTFFIEVTRPGYATHRKTLCLFLTQMAFIPLYLLFPVREVIVSAYALALVMALYTATMVIIFTARYERYIEKNYSYTENLDVKWMRNLSIIFLLLFLGYIFAFGNTTWLGEAIYNSVSLVLWLFLFSFVKRHRVLDDMVEKEQETDTADDTDREQKNYDFIAERLSLCMEKERLYLNPKVSIYDVALGIGTNKTYLSDYLNHRLGITFYDYINNFRVRRACEIMDAMLQEERKNMTEIAQESGFNSLSSFNRYFLKMKGISPKKYSMGV